MFQYTCFFQGNVLLNVLSRLALWIDYFWIWKLIFTFCCGFFEFHFYTGLSLTLTAIHNNIKHIFPRKWLVIYAFYVYAWKERHTVIGDMSRVSCTSLKCINVYFCMRHFWLKTGQYNHFLLTFLWHGINTHTQTFCMCYVACALIKLIFFGFHNCCFCCSISMSPCFLLYLITYHADVVQPVLVCSWSVIFIWCCLLSFFNFMDRNAESLQSPSL